MNQPLLKMLLCLCGFAAMAYLGFFIRTHQTTPTVAKSGWCCVQQGSSCAAEASVESCQAKQGTIFSKTADVCNAVCSGAASSL